MDRLVEVELELEKTDGMEWDEFELCLERSRKGRGRGVG